GARTQHCAVLWLGFTAFLGGAAPLPRAEGARGPLPRRGAGARRPARDTGPRPRLGATRPRAPASAGVWAPLLCFLGVAAPLPRAKGAEPPPTSGRGPRVWVALLSLGRARPAPPLGPQKSQRAERPSDLASVQISRGG